MFDEFGQLGPRHFESGIFVCPECKLEFPLETAVPRPWVHWPVNVKCPACGREHLLEASDVRQPAPAFGYE